MDLALWIYAQVAEGLLACILGPLVVVGLTLAWMADQVAGSVLFMFGAWQLWPNFLWTLVGIWLLEVATRQRASSPLTD